MPLPSSMPAAGITKIVDDSNNTLGTGGNPLNVAGGSATADVTQTGTITANGQTVGATCANGESTVAVDLRGTSFSASTTIQFEATTDGTNYVAIQMSRTDTGAQATSAAGVGAAGSGTGAYTYTGNVAGRQAFRVRASAFGASDSVSVAIRLSTGSGSAGGGGGGAVTVADGADVTQGLKADSAASDSTSSWSAIALLKGLYAKLAGTLTVGLPSGASTAAKQPALGTAGTPSTDVISVQGVASGTPQPVSGTITANAGTNLNTSALALEAGGNLATLVTNTADLLADGDNLTTINTNTSNTSTVLGATGDAAVVGDNTGSVSAKLRGLIKILNDIWDSVNHRIKVDGSGVTQPVSGTITANAGTGTMNVAQQASGSASATLQNAQAGNANGTPLTVLGMGVVMLTVNMTGFTGTVNFEGQEDGTNFKALNAVQVGTSTIGTTVVGSTTTAIYLFEIPVAGLQQIQARTSGVSAGTVTVTAHAVPVPYNGKIVDTSDRWARLLGQVDLARVLGAAISNVNPVNSSLSVSTATAAYGSNPAATGTGTDVLFKWGGGGTTPVNHESIQNNTTANVLYAFDVATTTAGAAVYLLAPGQTAFWDRQVTILHVQTAAAQNFGGTAGITVEGFA